MQVSIILDRDLMEYPQYKNNEKVYLMAYNYHFINGSWLPDKYPTVYAKYIKFESADLTANGEKGNK